MKRDKIIWSEQMAAVVETIAALPDDVSICRVFNSLDDRLTIQIIKNQAVTGNVFTDRGDYVWAESTAYPVMVGWCDDREGDNDNL